MKYKKKWYVATADYGNKGNEVRLYNPSVLQKAKRTAEKGVLYKKFVCSPWIQNLHWIEDKGILVLIQNQIEGKKWRFTYDLAKSIDAGKQEVIKVIDIERDDELENQADYNNSPLTNFSTKDYYFPIPLNETKLNPTQMYQNPGY